MKKTTKNLTAEQIRKQTTEPITREGRRLDALPKIKLSRNQLKDSLESQGD